MGRDFTADAPGTKLVGDITYLPTWQGFCYLATVIDCCTKECIGYAIADHMRAELVIDALRMAARNYPLAPEAIFHSDHGSQYLSQAFAEAAARLDIRQSVGRVGSCFDNALAESFNATLKVERVNRTAYPTREHARKDVARYIEFRYNTKRLHSALGYRYPTRGLQRVPERPARSLIQQLTSCPENVGPPSSVGRNGCWNLSGPASRTVGYGWPAPTA